MKLSTQLRLFGAAVILFNLWLIGSLNLTGPLALLLTFGFAIGFEFLVVRPIVRKSDSPSDAMSNANKGKVRSESISVFQKVPRERIVSPQSTGSTVSNSPTDDSEAFFALVAQELESGGNLDKGLWTRLLVECAGDETQTKVLYIKQRVERLTLAENERLRNQFERAVAFETSAEFSKIVDAFLSGAKLTSADVLLLAKASTAMSELVYARDKFRGDTLLHWCYRYSLQDAAAVLVANGADTNAPNGNGQRPSEVPVVQA